GLGCGRDRFACRFRLRRRRLLARRHRYDSEKKNPQLTTSGELAVHRKPSLGPTKTSGAAVAKCDANLPLTVVAAAACNALFLPRVSRRGRGTGAQRGSAAIPPTPKAIELLSIAPTPFQRISRVCPSPRCGNWQTGAISGSGGPSTPACSSQLRDGHRTTGDRLDSQLKAPNHRHAEKRLCIGRLDFHGPGLAVPEHCRHVDIKRKETPVRELPLLSAQPR